MNYIVQNRGSLRSSLLLASAQRELRGARGLRASANPVALLNNNMGLVFRLHGVGIPPQAVRLE